MNNNNFVLYLHIAPNGKKYFGITGQAPKKRWNNGHGYKTQSFYRAIEKYGWNNIKHVILANGLTEKEACFFEQVMIALYDTTNSNNGYNVSLGGEHSSLSETTKQKISEAIKGINRSEETKRKISEAKKGKTGFKCPNSKAVMCLTTKKIFGSAAEAGKSISVNHSDISKCCRGERKSAGRLSDGTRLVWKYVSDLPKPQLTESDKEHLRNLLNKYNA